jgi:membrane protein DedA with SNARE-associated domain
MLGVVGEHDGVGEPAALRLLDRVPAWWLVGGLVVTVGSTFVADVVWPLLVHDHPLALMVLSSRARHVILVASRVDVVPFVTVATVRLVLGDLFAFAIGRRYGDRAIEYLVRRSGRWAHQTHRAIRLVHRSAPLAVVLGSGTVVFAVVGATRIRLRQLLLLDTVSTAVSLVMTHAAGDAFASPITAVLDVVADHRWLVTGAMLVVVSAVLVWRRTRPVVAVELEELERRTPGITGRSSAPPR